jgi:hypothetical protein
MNQRFLDDAIDAFLEDGLRLERGVHGYHAFPSKTNLRRSNDLGAGLLVRGPERRFENDDLDAMIDEASRSRGGPSGSPRRTGDFLGLLRQVIQNLNTAIQNLRSSDPAIRGQSVPLMNEAIGWLNNAGRQVPTFLNEQQTGVQRHLEEAHRGIQEARLRGDPTRIPRIPLLRGRIAIQRTLNAVGSRGVSPLHNSLRELLRLLNDAHLYYQQPPVISRGFLNTLQQAGQLLQQVRQQVPAFFANRQIAVPRQIDAINTRIRRALNQARSNPQGSILELNQAIRLIRGVY